MIEKYSSNRLLNKPPDFATLKKELEEYLKKCYSRDDKKRVIIHKHPTLSGFAIHCGVSVVQLNSWLDKEDTRVIKDMLDTYIEEHNTQQLYRKEQVLGVMFFMKNKLGWKDNKDDEETKQGLLGALQGLNERKKQALQLDQEKNPQTKKIVSKDDKEGEGGV